MSALHSPQKSSVLAARFDSTSNSQESLFQSDTAPIQQVQRSYAEKPECMPREDAESIYEGHLPLNAAITVITSPNPVTKSFSLSASGELEKSINANVSNGDLSIRRFQTIKEFGDLLDTLNPYQCLTYGTPEQDGLRLMTHSAWVKAGRPDTATARTKLKFQWPTGAGILMLDYDAPKDGTALLSRDELFDLLYTAFPLLAQSDALWMPSTSSEIYNSNTNEQLTGIKGQRIYFMLKDASDIPRTGKALLTHLWAAGHGRFEVSSSGSLLERGVFDASVWQTNRIDFAGGASCTKPLEQRRGVPLLIEGSHRTIDSKSVVPDPSDNILMAAEKHRASARSALVVEREQKRAEWTSERIKEISVKNSKLSSEAITSLVNHAVDRHRLQGDWQIIVIDDKGSEFVVSVGEIIDNPEKYHHMLTLDPLEPDYDGRRSVGKLFLQGQPYLHSYAHGGVRFTLSPQLVQIETVSGREYDAVNSVLHVMRDSTDIFDFGTALVTVSNGKTHALNEAGLRYWLGGVVQFWHWKMTSNGQRFEVLEDPSISICKSLSSLSSQRELNSLRAVITAPTLRVDGSVLDIAGYDAISRLLLDIGEDNSIYIPTIPTEQQAQKALDTLWFPFSEFPFVDELARTAHLAALLTASIRPAVPTAPAFGYDAPVQGSGKTLLAQCVAVLATGFAPEIYPHLSGSNDDEMRKRLFSSLLAGDRAIVLDNIMGSFDSAAMASLLTASVYKDRILGKSESASVPNNAIVLLTGNNMVLAGDMPRRVIICRIDPQSETPFGRSFDINPLLHCLENRQQMIAAALTLIRFYLTANVDQPSPGKTASFELWDHFVRQTIVHLDNTIALGQFGDVMDLIKRNQTEDPEQESLRCLLQALQTCFGIRRFTARDIVSACTNLISDESNEAKLSEAVNGILGNHKISSVGVGKMLKFRKDRLSGGLQLKVVRDDKNSREWQIVGLPA